MILLLQLLICIVLVKMAIQDFKLRKVSVVLLLIFLIVVFFRGILLTGIDLWGFALINAIILIIQTLLVSLYVWVSGSIRNYKNLIGWGDILFIGFTVFAFSPEAFIIFYILSFFIAILVHTIRKLILNPGKNKTIPLVGYMSLIFIVWTFTDLLFFNHSMSFGNFILWK